MKTITQPSAITPTIIELALLAETVTLIGVTGKRFRHSNIRVDIVVLVIIGIAICQIDGIGRVAALGIANLQK